MDCDVRRHRHHRSIDQLEPATAKMEQVGRYVVRRSQGQGEWTRPRLSTCDLGRSKDRSGPGCNSRDF